MTRISPSTGHKCTLGSGGSAACCDGRRRAQPCHSDQLAGDHCAPPCCGSHTRPSHRTGRQSTRPECSCYPGLGRQTVHKCTLGSQGRANVRPTWPGGAAGQQRAQPCQSGHPRPSHRTGRQPTRPECSCNPDSPVKRGTSAFSEANDARPCGQGGQVARPASTARNPARVATRASRRAQSAVVTRIRPSNGA